MTPSELFTHRLENLYRLIADHAEGCSRSDCNIVIFDVYELLRTLDVNVTYNEFCDGYRKYLRENGMANDNVIR